MLPVSIVVVVVVAGAIVVVSVVVVMSVVVVGGVVGVIVVVVAESVVVAGMVESGGLAGSTAVVGAVVVVVVVVWSVVWATAAVPIISAASRAIFFIVSLHSLGRGRAAARRLNTRGRGGLQRLVAETKRFVAGIGRRLGAFGVERVACGTHGADDIGLAAFVDRHAQAADMHVHGARFDIAVTTPHRIEQPFAGEHHAGMF